VICVLRCVFVCVVRCCVAIAGAGVAECGLWCCCCLIWCLISCCFSVWDVLVIVGIACSMCLTVCVCVCVCLDGVEGVSVFVVCFECLCWLSVRVGFLCGCLCGGLVVVCVSGCMLYLSHVLLWFLVGD